ncbi:MAG: response regulator [Nitrospirota bacterium]|jgi:CheY-like chemotaxis protein|nr:response regulator [Nitrospirota bacterium]MDH4359964.1 response regulator [Nitrospirota bacterium]MDH5295604.1 response regulator [Nitrospirota bacterium]MDH5574352.1 response regulator [Nitrospirota bacterium]
MTDSEARIALAHVPQPPTILVVENDSVLRARIKSILETAGYTCEEAREGKEALSVIQRNSTAYLVLSDLRMPNMDGLQLLHTLQKNPDTKGIPFILITGNSSFSLRKQALRDGALAIIYKPYTPQELLHILNRSISLLPKSSVLSVNSVFEEILS